MQLFSEENQRRAVYKAMNQASEDQNRMLAKYEQMMKEKAAKKQIWYTMFLKSNPLQGLLSIGGVPYGNWYFKYKLFVQICQKLYVGV